MSSAATVRIVSYNLLTPNYASPRELKLHPPAYLDPYTRFDRILAQLDAEVDKGAVICLQEVNRAWGSRLHAYFSNRGYHFVYSSYGRPSSGYFGVGVAWKTSAFEALEVDMTRVADTKTWPAKTPPRAIILRPAFWVKDLFRLTLFTAFRMVRWATAGRLLPPATSVDTAADDMREARERANVAVTVHLRSRVNSRHEFWLTTYHMPCEYRRPRVMTVHAALVAQKLQRLAHGLPHVLCGDFNFGPTWPQYQMITTGSMPADDPAWPLLPESDNWEPRLDTPLRSAIKEKHGQEPEFTCYAFQSKACTERFISTLDYIFVSPQWRVLDASRTPMTQAEALLMEFPFPNQAQPSDHLLIHADLAL